MKTLIDYTNVIKTYIDENSGTTIVQIPSVIVDNYTYNGTAQGPTVTGFDSTHCNITNATKTNAGTYTLTISLKDPTSMLWRDFTTADRTYEYTIAKADADVTLSKNSVSLDANTPTDTVTISDATGTVTVSSSDANVATATLSNDVITITGVTDGSATVSVTIAGDDNYNGVTKTISVQVALRPALVSWSTGTDEEIKAMLDAFYAGILTRADLASVWSIGDERTVSLSAMSATGVSESHIAQNVTMVLMNSGGKTLSIGGSCAYIVGQKNLLSDAYGYMNSSSTNAGGWKNSARRTWCNNTYYNAIASGFKALLKQFVNKSGKGGASTSGTENTTDWVALPAEIEIFGSATYSVAGEGSQFKYYQTASNRIKKSGDSGYQYYWWERSPTSGDVRFCYVDSSGNADQGNANTTMGIAPFFCI